MPPPPQPDPAWARARRVLAVRLDNLGDVLMTTPALAAIRHSLPQAHITLLASPSGAMLQPHLPLVDEVITHRASWMKHERPATALEEMSLVHRLAESGFDAAVIFTVCTQSPLPAAMLCRLAGIPLRAAYCRENPYSVLTHWLPEPDLDVATARHEVQRQLDLCASLGWQTPDPRLRFALNEGDHASLAAKLRLAGLAPGGRWIVVHPGATAASRRYPAERFGEAAEAIAQDSGCGVVYTGGVAEQAVIAQAQAAMRRPSISLAGALSLGELGALVAGAQALVSNNSGPVHLAAALGTPVVDLYALTNPQHTPWAVPSRVLNHDVPCRNCLKSVCPQGHHDCLAQVPAQAVAEAALQLMSAPRATVSPLES
ncbi:lipopolysaccharide heptosyltransferase II [Ideonella sp. BN130291]|uniref:lipopolysaccharide heptosyltransferase II n=1 Tax=Ideonella sp. BN130291 TaxID=3112940 RepID=UPI002E2635E0|nr:lipopolysaccharide heptosyltransferase II [Ideonella sp. BN130291]